MTRDHTRGEPGTVRDLEPPDVRTRLDVDEATAEAAELDAHRRELLGRMAARTAARLEQIRDDEGTLL